MYSHTLLHVLKHVFIHYDACIYTLHMYSHTHSRMYCRMYSHTLNLSFSPTLTTQKYPVPFALDTGVRGKDTGFDDTGYAQIHSPLNKDGEYTCAMNS